MSDHYAVMGNPIGHSRSPQIHSLFAQQTGEDVSYEAMLVPLDGFTHAVQAFRDAGGCGVNITVPFKEEAFRCADARSPAAECAGAVNTLRMESDGRLFGDNTDGIGLLRDLTQNHALTLQGKRLLLLGAGGAARGVLQPLLAEQPADIVVANRTPSRAADLARAFAHLGPVEGAGFDALGDHPFDLIINATSAELSGALPELPSSVLTASTWCYDMMYGAQPTAFMRWARAQGAAQAVDGLGMLVEQAGESFFIWRGRRPQTRAVIDTLRGALSGTTPP